MNKQQQRPQLDAFLKERACGGILPLADLIAAEESFALSAAEIESCALQAGLLPARYQRNRITITVEEQLRIFSSRVAIVGCGGLGGYLIEELARLGVGGLTVIDPDLFEEHNLNRQLLCTTNTLGQEKTKVAARRIAEINPAVTVRAVTERLSRANGLSLLSQVDVVADAVDSIAARYELATVCDELGLPLVHGAIAGWYGHVCTIFPGEQSLQKIYHRWQSGGGIEQELGNPAFTPAVVASLEVAEICKILLGKKSLLRNKKLVIDLLHMEMETIEL